MLQERRLHRWREAGLIDDAAVARILAWEAQQQRPWLLYSIGGLGALTVALGFLALIASNWEAIGPIAKLAADLIVGAGLAYGLVQATSRDARWGREILIILLYGWTLASIGLVSQIYNMGGETWQALLYWNALTALLITRGRSGFVASVYLTGLLWMCGVMGIALGDRHAHGGRGWAAVPGILAVTLILLASGSRWIERARPAFTRTATGFGWPLLFSFLVGVPECLNLHWQGEDVERYFPSIALAVACTFTLVVAAPRIVRPLAGGEVPARAALLARVLFGLLLSVGVAAFVLPHDRLEIVAALAFIALWALVAALAHALGQRRLLSTATGMIGIRILIVYVQVFGSLLKTGVGMIASGLLTLGLVWLWIRKSLRRAPAGANVPSPGPNAGGGADPDDLGGSL